MNAYGEFGLHYSFSRPGGADGSLPSAYWPPAWRHLLRCKSRDAHVGFPSADSPPAQQSIPPFSGSRLPVRRRARQRSVSLYATNVSAPTAWPKPRREQKHFINRCVASSADHPALRSQPAVSMAALSRPVRHYMTCQRGGASDPFLHGAARPLVSPCLAGAAAYQTVQNKSRPSLRARRPSVSVYAASAEAHQAFSYTAAHPPTFTSTQGSRRVASSGRSPCRFLTAHVPPAPQRITVFLYTAAPQLSFPSAYAPPAQEPTDAQSFKDYTAAH